MATKTFANVRAIMSGLIQDAAGKLPVTTRNQAIRSALSLHAQNIPAIKFQIVTGVSDGCARTPTGWADEMSQIKQLEYPLNDRPPVYLEEEDFSVIAAATAATPYRILFINSTPAATAPFGVRFTAPHFLGATASQNTIPDAHIDAVANLSASIACQQLSAFYSQQGDNLINADSVNNQSKTPNYLQLAKVFMSYYVKFFKIDEQGFAKAATINIDIDRRFSWGEDFMYHPRRWR